MSNQQEQPPTIRRMLITGVGGCIVILMLLLGVHFARARDVDGRYANSPNKEWFEGLHSKSGAWCCNEADGEVDPTWRREGDHYQVMIRGNWMDVPDDAIITAPNLIGKAVVWPIYAHSSVQSIRCFMPGSMT